MELSVLILNSHSSVFFLNPQKILIKIHHLFKILKFTTDAEKYKRNKYLLMLIVHLAL